jgi:hypothetical protein
MIMCLSEVRTIKRTDGGLLTSCLGQETKRLLRKQQKLVLDAFEGHLTLDVRSVIHAMNAI